MTEAVDVRAFQSQLRRLDELLQEIERFADPEAQEHVRELAQAVLALHGAGLTRLMEHLAAAGEASAALLDALGRDEVVGGMLLLHGLHPMDLERRVAQALADVRPALRGHGGDVALVGLRDGVVHLRLEGNCHGCPSSAATMKQTIEEAIFGRAPDVVAVEVEGLETVAEDHGARFALPVLT